MSNTKTGTVAANGLTFHYLEVGEGPLALCLHGFPDSPHTYRHLMPELAKAGFRAVAIYMRGYAPTSIPEDGDYSPRALRTDVNALHEALGGNGDAVLLAHDWGTGAAFGAMQTEPARWSRAVIGSVPPLAVFGDIMTRYEQIKRSFYFWFFQMAVAQDMVAANDLAFLDALWADWSPNFDATQELKLIKPCLRDPKNLEAALGYYRYVFDPERFGQPDHMEGDAGLIGAPVSQPTLYIHGTADGCISLAEGDAAEVLKYLGPGSRVVCPEGVGHFFLVEKPEIINPQIVEFLTIRD